ncbi:MAG: hypothetical protein EOO61_13420 [Hymenobacter sp.]|nr:MAG: hypothetical protein EOO61_13420 [Hymenobacter sp.]
MHLFAFNYYNFTFLTFSFFWCDYWAICTSFNNRLFSDNEFEKATRNMDYLKFTMGGVDFSVLIG